MAFVYATIFGFDYVILAFLIFLLIISIAKNYAKKWQKTHMSKKLLISNSIMWAAAILVVAIVEEKQFAILMLVVLATTSLMFLKKGNEKQK